MINALMYAIVAIMVVCGLKMLFEAIMDGLGTIIYFGLIIALGYWLITNIFTIIKWVLIVILALAAIALIVYWIIKIRNAIRARRAGHYA